MEEVQKLQEKNQNAAPLRAKACDFLNVDEDVILRADLPQTEEDILAELQGGEEIEDSQNGYADDSDDGNDDGDDDNDDG